MNLRVLPKTENTSETGQTFPTAGLKFSYVALDESRLSAFLIEVNSGNRQELGFSGVHISFFSSVCFKQAGPYHTEAKTLRKHTY